MKVEGQANYTTGDDKIPIGVYTVYSVKDEPFGCFLYGMSNYTIYMHPVGYNTTHINYICNSTLLSMKPGDGIDNECDENIDEEEKDGKDNDQDSKIDEDLVAAVNGGWSAWSEWFCPRLCENGTYLEHTRKCNNPPPKSGSVECIGEPAESNLNITCKGTDKICPSGEDPHYSGEILALVSDNAPIDLILGNVPEVEDRTEAEIKDWTQQHTTKEQSYMATTRAKSMNDISNVDYGKSTTDATPEHEVSIDENQAVVNEVIPPTTPANVSDSTDKTANTINDDPVEIEAIKESVVLDDGEDVLDSYELVTRTRENIVRACEAANRNLIDKECRRGAYGLGCEGDCRNCEDDCEKINGSCQQCKLGFSGPERGCTKTCPPLSYGYACRGSCLEKCGEECLDTINGECQETNHLQNIFLILLLLPPVYLIYICIRRCTKKDIPPAVSNSALTDNHSSDQSIHFFDPKSMLKRMQSRSTDVTSDVTTETVETTTTWTEDKTVTEAYPRHDNGNIFLV
ncbi:hypothetical protein Btru_070486 [Bulinus truncatus]|nr:hypothetical protein Btru_070486 [Bulinus truncatus]